MTTWRVAITEALEASGESWANMVATTFLTDEELDREFDNGYGGENGEPFTMWTHERVYFPVCYDGAEWVSSVPRNPCDQKTKHVGGG